MRGKPRWALSRTAMNLRTGGSHGRLVDRVNSQLRGRPRMVAAIIVLFMTATFLLDLWTPLGLAVWIGYVIPVFLALWLSPVSILLVGLTSALLVILNLAWSPPGMPMSFAIANRVLGLGLIGMACLFLLHRQALESRLEASERRLEAALDNALDAVIGADIEGRIIQWNAPAEELFGWECQDVMGRGWQRPLFLPIIENAMRRACNGIEKRGRRRS